MDPRPRNNQGQFASEQAGGIDAATTSTAYNPQIIEARKASLAEKLRRAIGLRRGVEESVPQEARNLSAKLRLRELARQPYDPYAPQQAAPAQPGQGARDFRNAALGVGALGAAGGIAYGGWRAGQAAQSAQTLADDALKTSAEARKAARSARIAAARVGRAGKWTKTQLTTFPTFKKAGQAVARALKFDARLELKELAAKSDEWRTGGYTGYLTGGIPNAYQGMETQHYYANKGIDYRKRDALKHAAPGFAAGAVAMPLAVRVGNQIYSREQGLKDIMSGVRPGGKRFWASAATSGIPVGAVLAVNALYGGKKQAVRDREKRIQGKEFSNREYDSLAEKNIDKNIRRVGYIESNVGSYPLAAIGGAGLAMATGGLLFGKKGVTKKTALLGAAGLLGARAALQPKINKAEDSALNAEDGVWQGIKRDSGLSAARHAPAIAALGGTAAILMNRAKILKATGKLAKKFRATRAGKWEVIPPPAGVLPMRSRDLIKNTP